MLATTFFPDLFIFILEKPTSNPRQSKEKYVDAVSANVTTG